MRDWWEEHDLTAKVVAGVLVALIMLALGGLIAMAGGAFDDENNGGQDTTTTVSPDADSDGVPDDDEPCPAEPDTFDCGDTGTDTTPVPPPSPPEPTTEKCLRPDMHPASGTSIDIEPNDGASRAAGPIHASRTYEGSTQTANDHDWYVLCIHEPGQVTITVTNSTKDCVDLVALLEHPDDTTNQINPQPNEDEEIGASVEDTGRYYLDLTSDYGFMCPGAKYSFSVQTNPAGILGDRLPLG